VAGATGITAAVTGRAVRANKKEGRRLGQPFAWNANHLCFSVREPWPSRTSSAAITFGTITRTKPLTLVSHMPEHGVIFSDGIEADFLRFNAGTEATVSLADKKGYLVG